MKKLIMWFLPVVISLALFVGVRPTLAEMSTFEEELSILLQTDGVEVGSESVDGFTQIYYIFDGEKKFVTDGSQNSRQPHSAGEYIVWVTDVNGAGQIFLYHIPSGKLIQLTYYGTNLEPKVSKNGNVAWEGWVDQHDSENRLVSEGWQILVFDGKTIKQITQGDLSVDPDIEGDFIVYARKGSAGLWRSVAYSIAEDKHIDVTSGSEGEAPRLENGEIFVGPAIEAQKRYALKITDLFLLDLPPLYADAAEKVSVEDILAEIEALALESVATESAVLEEDVLIEPATGSSEVRAATDSSEIAE